MKLLWATLFMMLTVQYFTASVRLHFTNHSLSYNERCVRALVRGVQIVKCVTNVRAVFKQNKNPNCWALSWVSLLNDGRGYVCSSDTDWLIQVHVFTLSQLLSRKGIARNTIGSCWYFFFLKKGGNEVLVESMESLLLSHRTYFEDVTEGCLCFG